eukprot:gene4388-5397_t
MSVEQPAPSLETEEDVTQWRVVIICALMAMFAAADRTIFSVASLPIATDFSLSMTTVGVLQSSFLFGCKSTVAGCVLCSECKSTVAGCLLCSECKSTVA